MNMLLEQVNKIRKVAKYVYLTTDKEVADNIASTLRQAADTIEALSTKLGENGDGWIMCDKDNLPDEEVLCCDKYGEMILGYIAEDERSETGFCAENDNEYMYDCIKWMKKPKP